ncbi:MAG: hypothetical protein R3200_12015 [Xanthomonadales bacterium]|nr:hypothetical protein [Xanthomonadales bacterium]
MIAEIPMHVRATCLLALAIVLNPSSSHGEKDQSERAQVSNNLNSIHGASADFIIGVGDHGVIIHFEKVGPRRMASGTTNRLLDVYVAAPDFAVAAGVGIVLLWNGEQWSPIVAGPDDAAYRGVWSSPEKDVVFYGQRRDGFETVCPYLPGKHDQPFCRRFDARFIGACGHSDAINLVLANGDIHRVNNAVLDPEGRFVPVYEQPAPLDLAATWFPDPNCGVQHAPEVMAVNGGREIWRFDGRGWGAVGEAVVDGRVPVDPMWSARVSP